jgi:hypothetical protein
VRPSTALYSKQAGDKAVVNARGFGSSGYCINCLGYVVFCEKHVGYDGLGALVIVSTA